MKTMKYTMAAATLMLVATGCSLEEENLSNVSTDQEWSTASGYEKLVNGCYFDFIRIIYGQAEDTYVLLSECGTDIFCDGRGGSNGGWSDVQTYAGSNYQGWSEGYCGFYACISACNAAIAYADKVTGLSQDEVDALVAEAYYLRAHSMFNFVEMYGGKYLSLTPMEEALKVLPMSTVNEWYDAILSDLKFAMQHLPVSQTITGHVERGAAYHLYAKACLSYAAYTDGLGNCEAISADEAKNLYQEALTASETLIQNAKGWGYALYDEPSQIFDENNNKENKEALFVVTHSTITAYNPRGNYFNRVFKHYGAYGQNDGIKMDGGVNNYSTTYTGKDGKTYNVPKYAANNCYTQATLYLLNSYIEKDQRYKAFFKDTWYVNTPTYNVADHEPVYRWTANDAKRFGLDNSRVDNPAFDIALNDTMVFISRETLSEADRNSRRYATYNVSDNHKDLTKPGKFFPSMKKHDLPSMYGGTNPGKCYTWGDCIVYRLGETYLQAAEAAWRLGKTDKAAEYINVIRNRACKGHDNSMNVKASDITQDFILDEYGREMCGEWCRWYTLKRFRAFESRLAKCNPQAAANFKPEVHYLRQIPLGELNKIDNKEEYQNPGY